jgi:hypothetical protein
MGEVCAFAWWKLPNLELTCREVIKTNYSTVESSVSLPLEALVGMLFIICAGILGGIIVELLYNKSDWFLTPLVNRVVKRYHYTIQRNRLRSMNGHP